MNTSAFTLIEVLVSVAIIGLLAAISFGNYQEYKARSYDSVARQEVENARVAIFAFEADNPRWEGNGGYGHTPPVFIYTGNPDGTESFSSSTSIADRNAALPGFVHQRDVKTEVRYTPDNVNSNGRAISIYAGHCKGTGPDPKRVYGYGTGVGPYAHVTYDRIYQTTDQATSGQISMDACSGSSSPSYP